MPIYEYQCGSCGHQLEILQKISEAALTDCPNCHKASLNKLISATSFQLKGTGWYVTDFRDKDKPKQAAAKDEEKKEKKSSEDKNSSGEGNTGSSTSGTSGSSSQSDSGSSQAKSNDGAAVST